MSDPYTVNPDEGLIYQGTPDNLGETVDAIYIRGSRYTLSGSLLVTDTPGAPNIAMGRLGVTQVSREADMGAQITYEVQQRQLNRGIGAQRLYGLAGTVNVFAGELGLMEVSLENDYFTKSGYRYYKTTDAYGNTIYGETAFNYENNAALQSSLYDPEAQYLSPTEALRVNFSRWLMSKYQDVIKDYMTKNIGQFPQGVNAFYYAADMLAQQADLSNLQVFSNYWV